MKKPLALILALQNRRIFFTFFYIGRTCNNLNSLACSHIHLADSKLVCIGMRV